jgi:hypothetical protein
VTTGNSLSVSNSNSTTGWLAGGGIEWGFAPELRLTSLARIHRALQRLQSWVVEESLAHCSCLAARPFAHGKVAALEWSGQCGNSAHVVCPPLGFGLNDSLWFRWQLKNSSLLTIT